MATAQKQERIQDQEQQTSGKNQENMQHGKQGFASMDAERQREIASKGGRAAHEKGVAHEFDSDEARAAGQKGGQEVSKDRDHMVEIGRKGGQQVSQDHEHMAEIGRKGGQQVSQNHEHMAEIGRKGGQQVSQDHEHMAEIGRKGGSNRGGANGTDG